MGTPIVHRQGTRAHGYVKAEWGTSDNNRRARYYTLTAAGRKQLAAEREEFERIVEAIQTVLRFA
jgi:PadR family transcriptional regulator